MEAKRRIARDHRQCPGGPGPGSSHMRPGVHSTSMGAWYWIGVYAGIGVALGILAAGLYPKVVVAALVGAIVGAALACGLHGWVEAIAGAVGGLSGGYGATPIAAGALR